MEVFVVIAEDIGAQVERRRKFRPESVVAVVADVVAVGVEEIFLTPYVTHHDGASARRTIAG